MRPLHLSLAAETAALLGMSRPSAFRAARTGRLPIIRLGSMRVPVIKLEELFGPISDARLSAAVEAAKAA